MVMLQRWSMEGEWSCYRGSHLNRGRITQVVFNAGRMVMLRRKSV